MVDGFPFLMRENLEVRVLVGSTGGAEGVGVEVAAAEEVVIMLF